MKFCRIPDFNSATKTTLTGCLALFTLYASSQEPPASNGQGRRPEFAFGAAYGRGIAALGTRYGVTFSTGGNGITRRYQTPVYTADLAYPLERIITVGPAVSIQIIHATQQIHISGVPVEHSHMLLRMNAGIRMLWNNQVKRFWRIYGGFRAGITVWHDASDPPSPFKLPLSPLPSAQLVGGTRFIFGMIGFGLELGLGTAPYLAQVHVAYRF